MKKFVHTALLSLSLVCTVPVAAETATIELTDGSKLRGELLSLKGGAYEIKTQTLGILKIPQEDIALVSYKTAATTTQAPSAASAESAGVASLQQELVGNPETLSLIMGLGNDPAIQAVVADPEIQAAIARGDFDMLMKHPKIQKMMRHPTVRQITSGMNR